MLGSTLACGTRLESKRATFFPQTNEIPGWSKTGETRVFRADRLWEYIDGEAEKYIRAGVQQTLTADYRYGDKMDVVADIFVMCDASGATTIFESQPAVGGQPVALGNAGRLYKGSLMLRKGKYFVRLVAFDEVPEASAALLALGRAIAGRLE